MPTLTERIESLEKKIASHENTIKSLGGQLGDKPKTTYSRPPKSKGAGNFRSADPRSGIMDSNAGFVIWNKADASLPAYGDPPSIGLSESNWASLSYNRHSHSRFAGGPLDTDTLELIAYNWEAPGVVSSFDRHSQAFWKENKDKVDGGGLITPPIKTSSHADGDTGAEGVDKIGPLDIHFDGDTKKWVASGGSISYLYPTWLSYS